MWAVHRMGVWFSLKKKETLTAATTWMSFEDVYAKLNKPVTKGQILCGPIYRRSLGVRATETELNGDCQGVRSECI